MKIYVFGRLGAFVPYPYHAPGCVFIALMDVLSGKETAMSSSKFVSVGIDVSADFSFMSIVNPDGVPVSKPFKIIHNNPDSLERALSLIRKAEESHSMKSHTFLESTGIYHFPLFCYLVESGFEAHVINPIITNSTKNINVRKVKNDKIDSLGIARLGLRPDLKVSLLPVKLVMEFRTLMRRHYKLTDERAAHVNQLKADLHVVFPGVSEVFSNITGKAATMILSKYPRPEDILRASPETLIADISKAARRRPEYSEKKYAKLVAAAELAKSFSFQINSVYYSISSGLRLIKCLDDALLEIELMIRKLVSDNQDSPFVRQIGLVDSIYGVGFLSAVTIMCEIGDFGAFKNPRQLFAYFGMDPEVRQSGNFNATGMHMSKRGSRWARRAIFAVALACTRKKNNGEPGNPHLHEYYLKKAACKPKMTAIGALMHKVTNIIFAVLRDGKPFELCSPEEHCRLHREGHLRTA
jgi:transposase